MIRYSRSLFILGHPGPYDSHPGTGKNRRLVYKPCRLIFFDFLIFNILNFVLPPCLLIDTNSGSNTRPCKWKIQFPFYFEFTLNNL